MGRDTTVQGTERCVVVKRCRRVVRIRLFGIANVRTVDLKLHVTCGDADTSRPITCDELDRMVVVKLLKRIIGSDGLLGLGNQHVLRSRRKSCALIRVEVDELGVYFIISIGRCWRGGQIPP